jgi:hypothetical protein
LLRQLPHDLLPLRQAPERIQLLFGHSGKSRSGRLRRCDRLHHGQDRSSNTQSAQKPVGSKPHRFPSIASGCRKADGRGRCRDTLILISAIGRAHDLGGYCSGTIGGGGDQATKNAVIASRLTTARTVSPASKLGIEEGRRISAMRMLNMTNSRPIVPTSRLR